MRIISGSAKGARLFSPTGRETRPTRDFVKEAVFNILGDIRGAVFLDLFAGTGAAGLEAKSRGAEKVFLVDSSKRAIELIKKNALKTGLEAEIFFSSAERFLRDYNNFDIAFLDPPYDYDLTKILSVLNAKTIIAERDKNSPVAEGYKSIRTYASGTAVLRASRIASKTSSVIGSLFRKFSHNIFAVVIVYHLVVSIYLNIDFIKMKK